MHLLRVLLLGVFSLSFLVAAAPASAAPLCPALIATPSGAEVACDAAPGPASFSCVLRQDTVRIEASGSCAIVAQPSTGSVSLGPTASAKTGNGNHVVLCAGVATLASQMPLCVTVTRGAATCVESYVGTRLTATCLGS